ncbi:cation:proton antiporter [Clostridium oceanicum]|uniref:Cation:proton antiporter n=1 Tax=Clostridium oceanicum TaxID=1543 RepID=A0ABN1JRE1_9CLOT
MATSLAIILLLGLIVNELFTKFKLPGLLGMILLGIVIGPSGFSLLNKDLLTISSDIRKVALIVILLRAGLGTSKNDLKKIGKTAAKLSCIPGLIEGFTIAAIATLILDFSFVQGGMLGFILAAVSPAVVVPFMLEFKNKRLGTNKSIPTLILAASSIDDVFAITIFTTFLGFYGGKKVNIGMKILNIPLSIILGVVIGIVVGLLLIKIFKKYSLRDTKKIIILMSAAIFLTTLEDVLKDKIAIASLLGVMTIGFILLEKYPKVSYRLSVKLNKVWVIAQIFLFVLVGAEVKVGVIFDSGLLGVLIIAAGLIARSLGVVISTLGTDLTLKERIFCVVSYTPKATVQAAIGGIPLALGVKGGDLMLAIAVLSILVTAPLGALAIKILGNKFLHKENIEEVVSA